ncbi:hypothetical protein F5Y14DRAFT_453109 [Nemania sp. NC0429]|nr:hypothetical protein F5Y14DRAFT_453109 [Nemania sp. NC0429]
MGEICNEGGLETFYFQIIFLPLARALECIDSDIRIYSRLPISGQPLNKNSTQATTIFTPDGAVGGRDRKPYLVFDYKYAYQTTPLDPVDGASPLNNSYVGQMISYCVAGDISDAMILKEDALIFLHITGPPNNDSTLTELSDALSDVDPVAPWQDAKRPWTAGSSTSSDLPQRKRIAFDPWGSPDPLANSSPNQSTNRGAIMMATYTHNPRIDSDPLALDPPSSPPQIPNRVIPYSSSSYRPSSSGSQRLEGFGTKYTYLYKTITIQNSNTWLASIFSYALSVKKMHEEGHKSMSLEMIDPFIKT